MSELSVGSLSGLAANSYVIDVASGSQLTQPGMILQVVSTTKTDTFSTTSTSYVDITGLSATITPSSTSSKILLLASVSLSANDNGYAAVVFERGGTILGQGDAAGSRAQAISSIYADSSIAGTAFYGNINTNLNYLDLPATTSATEYFVQLSTKSTFTAYVNRSGQDSDSASYVRSSSTITLMEIAG